MPQVNVKKELFVYLEIRFRLEMISIIIKHKYFPIEDEQHRNIE